MKLVCGVVRFDEKPVARQQLRAMFGALVAPGLQPVERSWGSERAALGTLTFAPGARPRAAEVRLRSSGCVLAADVRLDREVAGEELRDADEASLERLLDGSEAGGLGSAAGDFALADWNEGRRELLLARDGMGVRPLVYHFRPAAYVVFASFPRAVHASGLVERRVDLPALAREMMGAMQPDDTLFEGLQMIEPGTAIVFSAARRQSTVLWRPQLRPVLYKRPDEAAEALRGAVEDAVRVRIRGRLPVAAHLSGGLDSSAIAVIAARKLRREGRPLLAYSFVEEERRDGRARDERPYVEAVLRQEPWIDWTPVMQATGPGDCVLKRDRVLSDSEDCPENIVCALASERGANVVLSGWGGDEGATFNGRGALATGLLRLRPGYVLREMRDLRQIRGFTPWQTMRGELLPYLVPEWLQRTRGRREDLQWMRYLAPKLRGEATLWGGKKINLGSSVERNRLALVGGPHLSFRALNWAETGARYGVEFSFPLLARRVIECALSISGDLYLRGGWKRRPFRDAMNGILPEEIRWRHDKITPFPASFLRLCLHRVEFQRRLSALSTHTAVGEFLDRERLQESVSRIPTPVQLIQDPSRQQDVLRTITLMNYAEFVARESGAG